MAVGFWALRHSLVWMDGEEATAFFHCRESLCTFVRMSVYGKNKIIFSRSSDVLKTALRAASVDSAVMLRVWRRGVMTAVSLRVIFRFCLPGQSCASLRIRKYQPWQDARYPSRSSLSRWTESCPRRLLVCRECADDQAAIGLSCEGSGLEKKRIENSFWRGLF